MPSVGWSNWGEPMRISPPKDRRLKSPILKRAVDIGFRKSSVSLEDSYWSALKEIAAAQNVSVSRLVTKIDSKRQYANLSSAIRLFISITIALRWKRRSRRRRSGRETRPPFQGFEASFYSSASCRSRRRQSQCCARQPRSHQSKNAF
ncbi:MAG: ribbon-helix-helix domain-containing protein [Xanthobacteraceae bacterium]